MSPSRHHKVSPALAFPSLIIDVRKIKENARAATAKAARSNIEIYGVTKGCAGSVPVARAMLEGGVAGLADSRLTHLKKLRASFPGVPLLALRQPMFREMAEIVPLEATVIVSDPDAVCALDREAGRVDRVQAVMLMAEAGDGREGMDRASLIALAENLSCLKHLRLAGLAINPGCRGGLAPDQAMMALLDKLATELRSSGLTVDLISTGNSSCLDLLDRSELASTANHLRLGESILLGREPTGAESLPGFHQDAFVVRAEVLEAADKLGGRRLVAAIGCRDTGAGDLTAIDPRLKVERLTSDHAVLTLPSDLAFRAGDAVDFVPSYFALQSLMAATHVRKAYIGYNKRRFSGTY